MTKGITITRKDLDNWQAPQHSFVTEPDKETVKSLMLYISVEDIASGFGVTADDIRRIANRT